MCSPFTFGLIIVLAGSLTLLIGYQPYPVFTSNYIDVTCKVTGYKTIETTCSENGCSGITCYQPCTVYSPILYILEYNITQIGKEIFFSSESDVEKEYPLNHYLKWCFYIPETVHIGYKYETAVTCFVVGWCLLGLGILITVIAALIWAIYKLSDNKR